MRNAAANRRNIVLVGPMGSGKSHVGRLLAARLGLVFVDVDARIEADAGLPIPAIFAGEGEAGPAGAPPGDLYVEIRVRAHELFERDGDDLHCEVPIRISQAALGDTVRVPTLGGEAEIRVPAETQTGKVFRLRDKGVKSVRSRGPGDLYCKVVVETPVNLTTEQRELLEKFETTFIGEGARKHSPRSSTFLDGVKGFWDRMVS